MTAEQFRKALKTLGLTYHTAAEHLRMGRWGFENVGKWARGEVPVPGSVELAIELMIERARCENRAAHPDLRKKDGML